jgi:hypothetical protein
MVISRSRSEAHAFPFTHKQVRIGTFNLHTCPNLDSGFGLTALEGLVDQLSPRGISLLGLQELRWLGEGKRDVGSWQVVWSGHKKQRQHGVGLLMAPEWRDACLEVVAHTPQLLSATFACTADRRWRWW